jgi:hypothetical protein
MQKHFALEEEGGYLASVIQLHPRMHEEVGHLMAEHREISQIMTSIFDEVVHLRTDSPLHIHDACARIANLIGMLKHHEDRENMLVSHVFTQDTGSQD